MTSRLKNSKGAGSYRFCLKFSKINEKHFQNSAKCTSLLNDALAVFSMKKVLTTIGIKKEETYFFLAPKNLFIIEILADLQPVLTNIPFN